MNQNQIRVFKDTKKRANEFAAYTDANGTTYPWVPRDLLEVVDLPAPPADYSPETHDRTEQDDAPYVVYTRKSDEQIAALVKSKRGVKLAAFRALREPIINRLNGAADRLARKGDATVRAKADDAIEALLAITDDLPADPDQVDAAIMAKYLAIRATLPDSLHKAFAQVDA